MTTAMKTDPRLLLLSPIDAWFFRDGRPYNQGETNQTDVVSLFPPPATTLVGAIRAGLAREQDWDGASNWATQPELKRVLGDGFDGDDALGALTFRGPWLVRLTKTELSDKRTSEFLFPMPLHVLGKVGPKMSDENARDDLESSDDDALLWQPHCLLTPADSKNASLCDLGEVRLPVTSAVRSSTFEDNKHGLKDPSSLWVTQAGLELILNGKLPAASHVVAAKELWKHEVRVGLKRDAATRTTKEGALYSPRFVRLKPGVSLGMTVDGLPNETWQIPELLPLGGEGRLADCRNDQQLQFPDFLKAPSNGQRSSNQPLKIAVVLLTPLLPRDGDTDSEKERGLVAIPLPGKDKNFFDIPDTTVVSACVGKPLTLGGWDGTKREPLPLRPVLPAGSVWFIEVTEAGLTAFIDQAKKGFGMKTRYGFGQVALGEWPKPSSGRVATT